jgi:hypothetical protein
MEPQFVITQTSRWKPLKHLLFSFSFQDISTLRNWHAPRLSEWDRQEVMIKLTDSMNALEALSLDSDFNEDVLRQSQKFQQYSGTYSLLKERFHTLAYQLNGAEGSPQSIPIELVFPTATPPSTPTIDSITPPTMLITSDGNDEIIAPSSSATASSSSISSSTNAVTQDIYVLGTNLNNVTSTISAASVASDTFSPKAAGFTVSAQFSDPDPTRINANYRRITVTFTPNAARQVPQFAMATLTFALDPTKFPVGTDTSTPVKLPPLAIVKKVPVQGLKPLLKNTLSNGGKTLDQTISVDPSLPNSAQEGANGLIFHGEDKEGIPVPGAGGNVIITGKIRDSETKPPSPPVLTPPPQIEARKGGI